MRHRWPDRREAGHRPRRLHPGRRLRDPRPDHRPSRSARPALRLPLVHPTSQTLRPRPHHPPRRRRSDLPLQPRPPLPAAPPAQDPRTLALPDPRPRHLPVDQPPPPPIPRRPHRHPRRLHTTNGLDTVAARPTRPTKDASQPANQPRPTSSYPAPHPATGGATGTSRGGNQSPTRHHPRPSLRLRSGIGTPERREWRPRCGSDVSCSLPVQGSTTSSDGQVTTGFNPRRQNSGCVPREHPAAIGGVMRTGCRVA